VGVISEDCKKVKGGGATRQKSKAGKRKRTETDTKTCRKPGGSVSWKEKEDSAYEKNIRRAIFKE